MNLLIKIEIIHMINDVVKQPENQPHPDGDSYNWMKENTPLLKKLDNSMMMIQQSRHFKITSLNIGKDDVYYVMNHEERINLEHGDILELDNRSLVKISLIHQSDRRDWNDREQSLPVANKRQFGMQFKSIVDGSSNNYSRLGRVDSQISEKNFIETIHDFVPSKSSFTPPKYIFDKIENIKDTTKYKNKSSSSSETNEKNHTFSINERPLDTIYKNQKESIANYTQSYHQTEKKSDETLYDKINFLFKKGER